MTISRRESFFFFLSIKTTFCPSVWFEWEVPKIDFGSIYDLINCLMIGQLKKKLKRNEWTTRKVSIKKCWEKRKETIKNSDRGQIQKGGEGYRSVPFTFISLWSIGNRARSAIEIFFCQSFGGFLDNFQASVVEVASFKISFWYFPFSC